MEQNTQIKTRGGIIQRVAKTDKNPHGIRRVKNISVTKPSVVIFGGETTNIKIANWYASLFERLIKFYKINGVRIYSAFYDFVSTNRNTERANAFITARHKLSGQPYQPVDTQYINDLYNIVIHPHIVDRNGNKLPDADALQNIRRFIFFDHCHGATPVREFQNMMVSDMRSLGYTPHATHQIMKNLLVIQHAPIAPLEKSLFNTVSFMSANDTRMDFHNQFTEYVAENNADLLPSYFPLGNFFVTHSFTNQYRDEHSITGLVPDEHQDKLTPDGAIIMAAERNAIINAIHIAKQGGIAPSIRDLIAPISPSDVVKPDFDTLEQNGKFFMNLMRYDLRNQSSTKER